MLKIKNLPNDIRCHEIETLFKKFGDVQEIKVIWKKEQELEAFLKMKEETEVVEAKEKLDGLKIDNKEIQIEIV